MMKVERRSTGGSSRRFDQRESPKKIERAEGVGHAHVSGKPESR
jgi:hypothetical protein